MQPTSHNFELHLTVENDAQTAVDMLHAESDLSRQQIKQAMTNGAVWLTRGQTVQRLRRAKRALEVNDELHLYYNANVQAEQPPAADLIADVGGYSVWRKPTGMRSQGSKWGDHCTIMRWAEQHLEPERTAFTVHRLDLAANGLILVAHSKAMAAALGRLFMEREIEKSYRAVVHGDFGQLHSPVRIEQPVDNKTALSEASLVEVSEDGSRSLVEVRIETGRKHQIRQHLSGIGFPILGDRMYGSGEEDGIDLQLTACKLVFKCPVNEVSVEYRMPAQWMPTL